MEKIFVLKYLIKQPIKITPLYYPLRIWRERTGNSVARHIIKQQTLKPYEKGFVLRILVETGTYLGDMVEAMKENISRMYSTELINELYDEAKKRFKVEEHVELIHGDRGSNSGT